MELLFFLMLWIVLAVAAAIVAERKGRSGPGWAIGVFLFPPVFIILLVLSPMQRTA